MTDKTPIYAPFIGIIPTSQYATEVIAPPYDVLSSAEAKEKAQNHPLSFLHISKAEIDFADNISPYDDRVYAKAAQNFNTLLANGILQHSPCPCYYIYQMTMGNHTQTGIVVAASVSAYNKGQIKRHELTRTIKENDRVKQIRALKAQTGPALLINKPLPKVKQLIQTIISQKNALFSAIGDNNVRHSVWEISNNEEIEFITNAFAAQNEAYIADGHHRSAAAARLAQTDATPENDRFLAVAFFEDEIKIMDYNRVVFDLNGLSATEFINAIKEKGFTLNQSTCHKPSKKGEFMMYLNHQWYEMCYIGTPLGTDPVSTLDVSILSAKVLDEILNITDLRNDERIDFIGGIRGTKEIVRVVDSAPNRVGFMVYPTAVSELITVADKNMLMPPKSTWFEPKLADGLISKAC